MPRKGRGGGGARTCLQPAMGILIFHLEAGSRYEAQAGLELTILLLSKSWDDAMHT